MLSSTLANSTSRLAIPLALCSADWRMPATANDSASQYDRQLAVTASAREHLIEHVDIRWAVVKNDESLSKCGIVNVGALVADAQLLRHILLPHVLLDIVVDGQAERDEQSASMAVPVEFAVNVRAMRRWSPCFCHLSRSVDTLPVDYRIAGVHAGLQFDQWRLRSVGQPQHARHLRWPSVCTTYPNPAT